MAKGIIAGFFLIAALSGCGAKFEHEVKPIHMTVDVNVNIKVDQKLDKLFSFEDQIESAMKSKGKTPEQK